jgi:hypothetical protein
MGFEVVSPILSGDEGLRQLRAACDALKAAGAKVNKSTGMHVHVDARDLTVADLRNTCKDFLKYETLFDTLVPASRVANFYCRSNLAVKFGGDETAAFATLDRCRTVTEIRTAVCGAADGDRYFKLNLQSLVRHGTVEFRQHGGTVEADKAEAWVRLVVGLVVGCVGKNTSIKLTKKEGRFAMLLGVVPADTRAFLRARRAYFARPAGRTE